MLFLLVAIYSFPGEHIDLPFIVLGSNLPLLFLKLYHMRITTHSPRYYTIIPSHTAITKPVVVWLTLCAFL
jgi:hypothetical protein